MTIKTKNHEISWWTVCVLDRSSEILIFHAIYVQVLMQVIMSPRICVHISETVQDKLLFGPISNQVRS